MKIASYYYLFLFRDDFIEWRKKAFYLKINFKTIEVIEANSTLFVSIIYKTTIKKLNSQAIIKMLNDFKATVK